MLFSVIVPIYKVEKYLKRCIDGVLSQSFADFELILVDDGSPDKCPEMCDDYAKKDARVKVIHKENGGLVSARQAGIKVAKGEYIFNLDADDALCGDALKNAYEVIAKTDADIVSFSYKIYRNGEISEPVHDLIEEGLYDKEGIKEHIFPHLLVDKNMEHIFYFVWGKAIKRTLLEKHQLNVNKKISLGEDLSCLVPCYLDAETVAYSKETAYLYTIRDDSISTSFNTKQISQIEDVIKGLREIEAEKPADFEEQIARYSCFMCFAIFAQAAEGNHFEVIDELKNLILNSVHREEIKKAEYGSISIKSRVGIYLMKKEKYKLLFLFLNFCKKIKNVLKRG